MSEQRKMTREQALLLVVVLMPLLAAWYIMMVAPLPWTLGTASAMLVLAAVAFVLLWRTRPNDRRSNRRNMLYGYFLLAPTVVVGGLSIALAKARLLQQFGLDAQATTILVVFVGIALSALILIPLMILLSRKQQRGFQLTDAEKAIEEDFKQTIRTMPTGWGMKPAEAIKQGILLFCVGILLGGAITAAAVAFAIYFALSGLERLQSILYFAVSLFFCLMGIVMLFPGSAQGLRLWRAGRKWREQATGTVIIQGMFADEWVEDKVGSKTPVRVERKDGSSKMLLVGDEFYEKMPEIGEDVQIAYLFGCEAVIDVKPLAGPESAEPAAEEKMKWQRYRKRYEPLLEGAPMA